jgi:Flp pilus assembly protein TadD
MSWDGLPAHLNNFATAKHVNVTVSAKGPYHWLNGARPHDPVPGLVATLFTHHTGTPVTAADLGWDRGGNAATFALADDGLAGMWAPGNALPALQHVVRSEAMPSRRTFLVISGMALTAAAHQWMVDIERLTFAAAGRRIDTAIVDDLDRIVAAKRRVDDALGGGVLYRSVREELAFVIELLTNASYSESIGKRLYAVAAELARLAGWACFDNAADAQAQRYFLVALRAAQLSGDRALGAHILGFMGVQSTLSGDPADAVTLLRSSHEAAASVMTATEKAALFGRLARAHGKGANPKATDECAEQAFTLLTESKPAEDPDWIYWCDDADLSGMIGEGYVALGDSDTAAKYLQRAVDGLSASRPRDRVIWITSLASAHLAAGKRDQALTEARRGAAIAAELNSDRIVGYLGDFRRHLGPTAGHAATADFDEYLRATFPPRLHRLLAVA